MRVVPGNGSIAFSFILYGGASARTGMLKRDVPASEPVELGRVHCAGMKQYTMRNDGGFFARATG